jgi:hypothetical protein
MTVVTVAKFVAAVLAGAKSAELSVPKVCTRTNIS